MDADGVTGQREPSGDRQTDDASADYRYTTARHDVSRLVGVVETQSKLAKARLYLCTDARRERGDLAEFADAALAGGVDIIQLRDKGSAGEARFGPLEARTELD